MNNNYLDIITNFIKKRTFELIGLLFIILSLALLISFTTYSPNDPSLVYGEQNSTIQNFFGIYGSIISDFLLQSFGLMSFLLIITLTSWGLNLLIKKTLKNIILKLLFVCLYLIFGCTYLYATFNNSFWLIDNGNSGFLGQNIYNFIFINIKEIKSYYFNVAFLLSTILFFILASAINVKKIIKLSIFFLFKLIKTNNEKKLGDMVDLLVEQNAVNEVT